MVAPETESSEQNEGKEYDKNKEPILTEEERQRQFELMKSAISRAS